MKEGTITRTISNGRQEGIYCTIRGNELGRSKDSYSRKQTGVTGGKTKHMDTDADRSMSWVPARPIDLHFP